MERKQGGHIPELAFDSAQAEFDITPEFDMCLSDNDDFRKMELSKDVSSAIKKVETNEDQKLPHIKLYL